MREGEMRHRAASRSMYTCGFGRCAAASGVCESKEKVVSRHQQKKTRGDMHHKTSGQSPAVERKPEGQCDRQRRKEQPYYGAWYSQPDGLPQVERIHVHGLSDKQQFDYKPCAQGDESGHAPAACPRCSIRLVHLWQDT